MNDQQTTILVLSCLVSFLSGIIFIYSIMLSIATFYEFEAKKLWEVCIGLEQGGKTGTIEYYNAHIEARYVAIIGNVYRLSIPNVITNVKSIQAFTEKKYTLKKNK